MATTKNVFGICDVCGFRYKLNQLKKNSYGLMVCSYDYDGAYDLKNHPQNRSPRIEERTMIRDIRPEDSLTSGANQGWLQITTAFNNTLKYWNLI